MILPIVKKHIVRDGYCAALDVISYSFDEGSDAARLGANAFASFSPNARFERDTAFVKFVPDFSLEERDEIYSVKISENGIVAGFRDERGAVNAAATVALLLLKDKLMLGEIIDYPSCSYRSIMIDMARGLPSEESINSTIKYMALAKYNKLHLHLTDSNGPCYASDAVPEYKFTGKGDVCNKDFLRRIEDLCSEYAIEVIPEIEIPSHARALCKARPDFICEVENADTWTICGASEGLWDFFEKFVAEIIEIFPKSKYIHIGSDEIEFLDLPTKRFCHWDECPRCARLRKKEGLADKRAEFYYIIEKMHEIVKSHGRRMIMWGDQIDVSKDVPLSRDILVEFWRVAGEGRGPCEGCSFEKLLEHGFTVINAHYPYTYFDEEDYMNAEKLKMWTPFNEPEQSPKYKNQVLGGEACAWEFGNESYSFYDYVTPAAVPMFADKTWGLGEREYNSEYRESLSEFMFGTKEFTEVFDYIGSLIPPRTKNTLTYADVSTLSKAKLLECSERLQKINGYPAASAYAKLLNKIADTI